MPSYMASQPTPAVKYPLPHKQGPVKSLLTIGFP